MFQPLHSVNIFVYLQSLQSLGFLWLDIKEDKKPIPEWRVVWCVQEKLRSSGEYFVSFSLRFRDRIQRKVRSPSHLA